MVSRASNNAMGVLNYQSAPRSIVSEHSLPSFAKSAERIDGAMNGRGAIVVVEEWRAKGKISRKSRISRGSYVVGIGSLTFILA
jgi:hypothetical protein